MWRGYRDGSTLSTEKLAYSKDCFLEKGKGDTACTNGSERLIPDAKIVKAKSCLASLHMICRSTDRYNMARRLPTFFLRPTMQPKTVSTTQIH